MVVKDTPGCDARLLCFDDMLALVDHICKNRCNTGSRPSAIGWGKIGLRPRGVTDVHFPNPPPPFWPAVTGQ